MEKIDKDKLEAYLGRLATALGPINISDKAEIITEIKSHVMDALSNHEEQTLNQILAGLGEPEQVANRYLLERGLQPTKPSNRPFLKWLVVGFLGAFSIAVLGIVLIVWRFTPLVDVNEKEGKVSFFGGMINIDETEGRFVVGGNKFSFDEGFSSHRFKGTHVLNENKTPSIDVWFNNGKIELENAEGDEITWDCKLSGQGDDGQNMNWSNLFKMDTDRNQATIDLKQIKGGKCEFGIPKGARVMLNGNNGSVQIDEPHFHADVKLNNGRVAIDPDRSTSYIFDTNIMNGNIDRFVSVARDEADFEIKVSVENGRISNRDD